MLILSIRLTDHWSVRTVVTLHVSIHSCRLEVSERNVTEPFEVILEIENNSVTNIGRKERKEGNVLFNDALNTFYLRLYCVGHIVKDHI